MKRLQYPMVPVVFLIFSSFLSPVTAQTENARAPLHVPRIDAEITVDARLDEEAWSQALVLELKYETSPAENVPAIVRTEVLVFHDVKSIYFGFRCYDPEPSAIRAFFSDRDRIGNDDLVNINLDTFNDERRNYFLGCNALGAQRDGIETPIYTDSTWDAIWDCAGEITDTGYTLEVEIPFSSLQFQRVDGPQIWGLDISRWYPRSVRHRLGLVPLDRDNNSYQAQFLKITGFEGITPGTNLELVPTLTALKTDSRDSLSDTEFTGGDEKADVGLTARWGVTPNFTLSGTVNPDFSQVEADSRQLDINEPFALWYQEKRPFFVEGVDFFRSQLDVVYTRTLRDPVWGVKLTGKESVNTVGAYFVEDDLTNLIFPGSQGSQATSLSMNSKAAVFRYKRDIGSRYTVGTLLTDREGEDYYNRVLGVDSLLRLTNTDQISFQALGSSTKYPSDVSSDFNQPVDGFGDYALSIEYNHSTRSLSWWADYEEIGPDFRADLGYMPQVGYRNVEGGLYYWWSAQPGKWWSNVRIGSDLNYFEDQDGNLLNKNVSVWLNFDGMMQSYIQARASKWCEAYNGEEFDLTECVFYGRMVPKAGFELFLYGRMGDRIDYANTRSGSRVLLNPSLSLNAGRHMKFSYDHTFERMSSGGGHLYTAHIGQATATYQLNRRTFFRTILQYVDYRYNVENYTFDRDPEYRNLFSQLLFSYKLNPRTVLFLGYSDNYLGNQEFGLMQKDRTFFMKLGYSWVL